MIKNRKAIGTILFLTLALNFGFIVPEARAVSADDIVFDDIGQATATSTTILSEVATTTSITLKKYEDLSIYLDKATIGKGYTVTAFDDSLKLSLVPGILSDDTRVDCEEITDEMSLPWNLEKISDIYQFEFRNKAAYDNHKPFYIQFSYDKKSSAYKRVFFFDKNYNAWRELPTRDYAEEGFVRSLIHLPYARIAVFADNSRMSGGQASWYSYKGGNFAASPDFPKGSRLRVYNLDNEKFVDVIVNDYGPDRSLFPERAIDLDKVAFSRISSTRSGIINVSIEPLYVVPDNFGRVLGISEKGVSAEPETESRSAIVFNEKTGETIWEKNSTEAMPLASLSKLIAVKVFLETKPTLSTEVAYSKDDENYNYEYCNSWESAKVKLAEGEKVTVENLIYSALVGSANNAVESLVRASGLKREDFIKKMNETVKTWGALKTKFFEPTGLSPENITTALDYAIITREVFKNPIIEKASITGSYKFTTIDTKRDIKINNTNTFIRDNFFASTNNLKITGSKTGYLDEALYCLMTRATGQNGEKVIAVNLGSSSREESQEEIKELLRYGISQID